MFNFKEEMEKIVQIQQLEIKLFIAFQALEKIEHDWELYDSGKIARTALKKIRGNDDDQS